MITLITGAPGTGKSAALVSLLSALSRDRAVHCSGIPELLIPHQDLADPTQWPSLVPDGSIIVIDEVQRVWRPRGPGAKVPPDIAALETHRHRGLDFYVVTQAPRLMDSNIRALVGRHVHLRDLGIIGRFWYEWPECADNCSTAWKNAPIKKRYRLPKSAFTLYKSASEHIKPIRSVPWMLAVMIIALLLVAGLTYKGYTAISGKLAPAKPAASVDASKNMDSIINKPASASNAGLSGSPYDLAAFHPPVQFRPESAPVYDQLRTVVAFPVVVGGYCVADQCKCITQQGTDSGLTTYQCKAWITNRPFNPYLLASVSAQGSSGGSAPSAAPGP